MFVQAFIPLVKIIRKTLNESVGVEVHSVIAVKRIPKTTSGKVQRHLLNEEYISGEYDAQLNEINSALKQPSAPAETATSDSIEAQVLQICNTPVTGKNLHLDDNLFEVGISSLALAEIHELIDEQFPGQVEISDLFDNPTVRELSQFIKTKTA